MKHILVPVIICTTMIGILASCNAPQNNPQGNTGRSPRNQTGSSILGNNPESTRGMRGGSGQMMPPEGSFSGRTMNRPLDGSGQMTPPPNNSGGTMDLPPL